MSPLFRLLRSALPPLIAVSLFAVVYTSASPPNSSSPRITPRSRADVITAMTQIQGDFAALVTTHEKYREAAERVAHLYAALDTKVDGTAREASTVESGGQVAGVSESLQATMRALREQRATAHANFVQLQKVMQTEARQFTSVSNVLKTKHETVKNAISNVR